MCVKRNTLATTYSSGCVPFDNDTWKRANTYVTQTSCEKALGVFDAHLVNIPLEDSAKLRHSQQLVTELHSDLVAKLPPANRPTLADVVLRVDGRAEGSRYPNLILIPVRQLYGI